MLVVEMPACRVRYDNVCAWGCSYGEIKCEDCGSLRKKYNLKFRLYLLGKVSQETWMKELEEMILKEKTWQEVAEQFPEAIPEWDAMWKSLNQEIPEVTLELGTNPEYLIAKPLHANNYEGPYPMKWVYNNHMGWMTL